MTSFETAASWFPQRPRARDAGLMLLLALLSIIAFARAVGFPLINYDDREYTNTHVSTGLRVGNISWAMTTTEMGSRHPLTWLSLQLDAEIWGGRPEGYHLTNVLLHSVNAALVFLVLRLMTGSVGRSFAVALLFAVHPLRVESVAWVSERKDVLCAFFWLLTMLAYWHFTRSPSIARMMLVTAGYAAGLASKPMVITLPCAMLLLDVWPLGRLRTETDIWSRRSEIDIWARLAEKIPLFVMMAAAAVMTFVSQSGEGAVNNEMPFFVRICNVAIGYCAYLRMTFWPSDLAILYPVPYGIRPVEHLVLALLLLATITIVCVLCFRSAPYLLVGWLWFLGTLVPVIGFVQVGSQAYADRYTYLPHIGLLFAIVWAVADLLLWFRAALIIAPGVVTTIVVGLFALTNRQLEWWTNSITVWERAVTITEKSFIGWTNLGHAHCDVAREHADKPTPETIEHWNAAVDCFAKASQIRRDEFAPHFWRAEAFSLLGKVEEAEAEARLALPLTLGRTKELHRKCLFLLGELTRKRRQFGEAIAFYEESLKQGDSWEVHVQLSLVLNQLNRTREAIDHLLAASALQPKHAYINDNLGQLYGKLGEWEKALTQFQQAVEKDPQSAGFRTRLAEVLLVLGQTQSAQKEASEAAHLDPQWTRRMLDTALRLATHPDPAWRQPGHALRMCQLVCLSSPSPRFDSLDVYAAAAASAGQFDVAQRAAEQAIQIARDQRQPEMAVSIEHRLALYRENKPYFQPNTKR